jgi:thioredoxin-like negative regulator of GroEL
MTHNVRQLGLITLDQFNFHQTLAQTPGVSLIFFTSAECSSCRQWRRLLTQHLTSHPDIRIFEVDAQRDMALTREFDVFHLPALFLFVDGEFHCPLQCEASMEKLRPAIARALAGSAQDMP